MYKCQDANGRITYSQRKCTAGQSAAKVLQGSKQHGARKDCIWPAEFAEDPAAKMQAGRNAQATMAEYGGANALSRGTVNIIDYVHQLRCNDNISTARIRALSTAKCQAGEFGAVACVDLPPDYTSTLGGCTGDAADSCHNDGQWATPTRAASRHETGHWNRHSP